LTISETKTEFVIVRIFIPSTSRFSLPPPTPTDEYRLMPDESRVNGVLGYSNIRVQGGEKVSWYKRILKVNDSFLLIKPWHSFVRMKGFILYNDRIGHDEVLLLE
jgi:hypothetical protein